jgi:glutamate-1-semialdehyde 2,1-aminomutase
VGALLLFDEVITGFRVGFGGAQEATGVTPDLTTFGKVIGGGLNIGAYGGARDVMQQVAPLGPVYQAGTLSGNPLATAAGLAALDLLDKAAYASLDSTAERLVTGLEAAFTKAGVTAVVPRAASLLGLFFCPDVPVDYVTAQRTDTARYAAFFHAMLDRGVALAPGAYEVLFPGLAHTGEVVDEIVAAADDAAQAIA